MEEEESVLDEEEDEHTFDNAELLEEEGVEGSQGVRKRNRRVINKETYYQEFESYMTLFQSFLETLPQGQLKTNSLVKKLRQLSSSQNSSGRQETSWGE